MGGGGRNSSSKREDPNYATTTKEIHELLCDWLHKVIYSVLCDTLVFVREATNTTISSGAETLDKSCWEYTYRSIEHQWLSAAQAKRRHNNNKMTFVLDKQGRKLSYTSLCWNIMHTLVFYRYLVLLSVYYSLTILYHTIISSSEYNCLKVLL